MKIVELVPRVSPRLATGTGVLYRKDVVELSKSFLPGEWIFLKSDDQYYVGNINPFAANGPLIHVLDKCDFVPDRELSETDFAIGYLDDKLERAHQRRRIFFPEHGNYRLVFGEADNLTGLTVDIYENCVALQITRVGMDRFCNHIVSWLAGHFTDKKLIFFEDDKCRMEEGLVSKGPFDDTFKIKLQENGLHYTLARNMVQKMGYYYDHRNNRYKLEQKIISMNTKYNRGLDLFCYAGSWGMHIARAGVRNVDFVDQGNMQEVINNNWRENGLVGECQFFRSDVFRFLDKTIADGRQYDLIISDPPAFSKSGGNVRNALDGYKKLCRKILKVLSPQGLMVIASCTHNISLEDLDKVVLQSSSIESRKIQLVDVGIQDVDHRFSSFGDKGFYLKYLLYFVE